MSAMFYKLIAQILSYYYLCYPNQDKEVLAQLVQSAYLTGIQTIRITQFNLHFAPLKRIAYLINGY